jgi:putative transposase
MLAVKRYIRSLAFIPKLRYATHGDFPHGRVKSLLPAEQNRLGNPRKVELPEVVNALMYVADNGIKWTAMPHDLPAWQTVYGYFHRWSQSEVWEQVNRALGREVRVESRREEQPSLGLIDSQSVEMAQKGGLTKASMATKR